MEVKQAAEVADTLRRAEQGAELSSPYGLVLRPSPEHAAGTFAVGVVVGDPETLRSMPIEVVQVDLGDRLSCGVWFGYLREQRR